MEFVIVVVVGMVIVAAAIYSGYLEMLRRLNDAYHHRDYLKDEIAGLRKRIDHLDRQRVTAITSLGGCPDCDCEE